MVTGGAGFIGSELVRLLCDHVKRVVVVDNLVNGRVENLAGIPDSKLTFCQADIRDDRRMYEVLSGIDVVFHLACLGVRHSIHSPAENHEVNASATLNLLAVSRDLGVKRFVYVSSSEVYGTARDVPMAEDHPVFPMTVYGASKLAGECYTRAYHKTYDFPTVVVRPFNSYGPRCHHEGDSGEVIPKFMLRCMSDQPMVIFGDGTQTRDFTFVSDTARGIADAGFLDAAIGQTINLGQGREITINDLAKEIARTLGINEAPVKHIEERPGDVLRLYADSTYAQELLSFKPRITLAEGLRMLKEWYEQQDASAPEMLEDEIMRNWQSHSAN